MARAVCWGTLATLGIVFALMACNGQAEPAATRSPSTSAKPASSGEARSAATGCPTPASDRISPGSVLVPGPSDDLPRSKAAGQRLAIAAIVLDPECRPAAGATVHVWHTDAAGEYGPGGGGTGEIECCYYQGTVSTDRGGGFRLETIRPGRYSQQNASPAHIHLEIHHASGDLMTELVFTDDPALPATAGSGGTIPVTLHKVHDADGDAWRGDLVVVLQP